MQSSHPLTSYKASHKAARKPALDGFMLLRRIPTKTVVDFTRTFSMMISAHLPLLQALKTAAKQCGNEHMQRVLKDVSTSIHSGNSLSDSLAKHPKVFDQLYVNLVRIGEESGTLDNMLMRLAIHQEKSADLRRKLKQAMTYPSVVIAVAIGATVFLLTSIVPTFAEMFASFGAELPGPTEFILNISNALKEHFFLICSILTCIVICSGLVLKQPKPKQLWHKWSMKIPLFGLLITESQTAYFCRMLGTLLESGVGLVPALAILTRSTRNSHIKKTIQTIKKRVTSGASLHTELGAAAIFPEMVIQMIATGEETAKLGPLLMHTASYYENEVDTFLGSLSSIIEPIMIVLIGFLLGSILVAMYLPMFDLVNIIQ